MVHKHKGFRCPVKKPSTNHVFNFIAVTCFPQKQSSFTIFKKHIQNKSLDDSNRASINILQIFKSKLPSWDHLSIAHINIVDQLALFNVAIGMF
jgi:hypothetical protein